MQLLKTKDYLTKDWDKTRSSLKENGQIAGSVI